MAHNHPSGSTEPSTADLNLTQHLKKALMLIDVRLLDHVIVTATATTSLAEQGQV
jgi:DNA repair protein RadC